MIESQIDLILLSVLGGAAGLTLSILLADRRVLGAGGPYLLGFIAVIMASALSDLIDLLGVYRAYPLAEALAGPMIRGSGLLLAPLLLFYVDRSTRAGRLSLPFTAHAAPGLIAVTVFSVVNVPDSLKAVLFDDLETAKIFGEAVVRLFWLAFLLQTSFYLLRCFLILAEHRQGLLNFFSTVPSPARRRLRLLWLILLLPILSIAVEFVFARLDWLGDGWRFAGGSFRILCLIAVCALFLRAAQANDPSDDERQAGEVERQRKYARAALGDDDAARLAARLQRTMAEGGLHRNSLLSLSDVARAIAVPEHRLSQLLNVHLGTSFFDYVNGWRVNEAKSLLAEPSTRTVLDIALAVGFNARSTFYTAFKKQEGVTPKAYRASRLPDRLPDTGGARVVGT